MLAGQLAIEVDRGCLRLQSFMQGSVRLASGNHAFFLFCRNTMLQKFILHWITDSNPLSLSTVLLTTMLLPPVHCGSTIHCVSYLFVLYTFLCCNISLISSSFLNLLQMSFILRQIVICAKQKQVFNLGTVPLRMQKLFHHMSHIIHFNFWSLLFLQQHALCFLLDVFLPRPIENMLHQHL